MLSRPEFEERLTSCSAKELGISEAAYKAGLEAAYEVYQGRSQIEDELEEYSIHVNAAWSEAVMAVDKL